MKVAPYTNCARTCKLPSPQLGSVLAGRWSASRRAQIPYHLRCTARSALSERLCTHQPGSRGWDGGCFLTFRRRYSLGVELSALQDPQSSRTLNARRWLSCRVPQRRPVALRRADRWPLVLLRYTAIHLRCILHLRDTSITQRSCMHCGQLIAA